MFRQVIGTWIALAMAICSGLHVAHGQDSTFEEILKKPKISAADRANLEAEISSRVSQLADADSNAQLRKDRMDYLIRMARTKGISPAGLSSYAELAARELSALTTTANFDSAFAAIRVVVEIGHIQTSAALASGLSSEHAAVRYLAAGGIRALHGRLKDDAARAQTLLRALSQQGAKESDPLVLEMIYKAVDFLGDDPEFKSGSAQAEALANIFAGRISGLSSGNRNEATDPDAISAAAAAYPKASKDAKRQLIGALTGLMETAISRYFADETSKESLTRLAETISTEEKAIRGMIQASKVKPPSNTIAAAMKGNDRQKNQAPARAALGELRSTLRGEPWNLP